jgi:PAS domain S-box-containing protein
MTPEIVRAVLNSPVIYYTATYGDQPEVRTVSPNAATVLGFESPEIFEDPARLHRHIHADDLADYHEAVKSLAAGDDQVIEYRLQNATGDDVWFRDELRLMDPGPDQTVNYSGCLINITREVELHLQNDESVLALRELGEDFHDVMESVLSGFCVTDKDGIVVAINSTLATAAGHDEAFFIGHPRRKLIQGVLPRFEIFHGQVVKQTEAWVDRIDDFMAAASGKSVEIKIANGSWILINFVATAHGGQSSFSTDISMQKQVEKELRDREVHFRTLVEKHPLPVILVDLESGQVIYESPAASEMFGREPDSNVPFHVQEMYAEPENRPNFVGDLRKKGELRDYPLHYRRADGTTYWISLNSRLIVIDGREFHITSMLDLTAQRARENALKKANETLEDAIEALSEGFALFDANNHMITCNSRFLEFNETVNDILKPGVNFDDLINTGVARGEFYGRGEVLEQYFKAHYDTDGRRKPMLDFEFRLQKKNRWLLYSSHPTRQNGFVVTLNDISRAKAMDRALRESEEQVRLILESSPTAIAVSRGRDNVVLYESPISMALFQRSEDGPQLIGRDWWVEPEQRDIAWKKLRSTGAIQDLEVHFRKTDGTTFWAAFSARLLEHQGEELIVSTMHDLTETREMQEEMSRQREALHVSEKMIAMGELLASVSHELNNPLSVVVGQTLLLQETVDDPAIAARAERIGNAADRCARIVKTFLSMARQQSQEPVPSDPNNLIEMALELTSYSLRGSNVEVLFRETPNLPQVLVDPDQITQVLTNLIVNAENALRKVDRVRQLRITSRHDVHGNQIIIKVKDNGPGIPSEIRRRVFEPFFTTKEVGEGTGIGLALCHRLIDANGGRIKLARHSVVGASFVIRLPAVSGEVKADASAPATQTSAVSLKILVVDDEPGVSELVSDILKVDGHAPVIANNGKTAFEYIQQQEFDLVLSDLRMPEYDGLWLFQQLKDHRPDMLEKLAFITGDTLGSEISTFLNASDRPFIEKPITPTDVRELVRKLLN